MEEECEEHVREMIDLGARFEVSRIGPGAGATRWTWEARPPIMRTAISRYMQTIDMDRPGCRAAMLAAVMRSMSPNAP